MLAKNFGLKTATFKNFPKSEVYIAKGPVPAPLAENQKPGSLNKGAFTHRYRLLALAPTDFPGGNMHIVSQDQFPISSTMTGAILLVNPGGLRELPWHPNAAEWQYYVRGKARMTVFGSHGRARTDEFGAGDVGYVPQGFGHYIENIGDEELKIVIVFNNATYESISITAWLASNPDLLLATNFGVPEKIFAEMPSGPVIIPEQGKV